MFFEDKTFWIAGILIIIVLYFTFIIKKRGKQRRTRTKDLYNI